MSGIFGGGPSIQPTPAPPPPKPTPPMPDLEAPDVLEASRRRREAIMARGGRRSTILSQGAEMAPYSRPSLGG